MALINNIQTLHRYLKVSVSNSSAKIPEQTYAEYKFVLPLLGTTLYNQLQNTVTTNENTNDPLVHLVRSVTAPLSYLLNLPTIHIAITDGGLTKKTGEGMQPIFRWEYEKLEQTLQDLASMAMDNLVAYLYENKTTLNWTPPSPQVALFTSGAEFCKYFSVLHPWRVFENIKPLLVTAEDDIKEALSDNVFSQLLTDDAAEAKEILQWLKKAVAHRCIQLCTELRPVQITANGFTVLLQTNTEKPNQGEENAGLNVLQEMRQRCEAHYKHYLQKAISLLNKTATDNKLAYWKQSDKYVDISIKPISPNENLQSFFAL